jgi:hypothetical protein
LVNYTLKLRQNFLKKRESAEKELEQEVERLERAGKTISSRTDLGFFVLIHLGSLRDTIAFYRHYRTLYCLSTFIFFFNMMILFEIKGPDGSFIIAIMGIVIILTGFIVTIIT